MRERVEDARRELAVIEEVHALERPAWNEHSRSVGRAPKGREFREGGRREEGHDGLGGAVAAVGEVRRDDVCRRLVLAKMQLANRGCTPQEVANGTVEGQIARKVDKTFVDGAFDGRGDWRHEGLAGCLWQDEVERGEERHVLEGAGEKVYKGL